MGINKFIIPSRVPLGKKVNNIQENLTLSLDNEMEFTKFKMDDIRVSFAAPDRGGVLFQTTYNLSRNKG